MWILDTFSRGRACVVPNDTRHSLASSSLRAIFKNKHSLTRSTPRFGWHNLRHSLATFFGSNDVHPSVIQTMLRHSTQQTTARYFHPVNSSQLEAQGLYLDAIKIRGKRKKASGIRRSRVESRVGKGRRKPVTHSSKEWWARGDSNPRPLPCQG